MTSLRLEPYRAQQVRWPVRGRHVLAQLDDEQVVVYQAYRSSIGQLAAARSQRPALPCFTREVKRVIAAVAVAACSGGSSGSSLPGGAPLSDARVGAARSDAALVRVGDHVILLGGAAWRPRDGAAFTILDEVARVSVGGDCRTRWQALRPLPTSRAGGAAAVVDGAIYYAGGFDGTTPFADVFRANVAPDGSIGSWSTDRALPMGLVEHALVAVDRWLFLLGGSPDDRIASAKVFRARIGTGGALDPWTPVANLPAPGSNLGVAVRGRQIYVVGGRDREPRNDVWITTVASDGALAPWAAGASLPHPVAGAAVVVTGDRVLAIGGELEGGKVSADILAATSSAGTLGAWSVAGRLSEPRFGHTAFLGQPDLHVVGGLDDRRTSPDVETADRSRDGLAYQRSLGRDALDGSELCEPIPPRRDGR